MARLIVEEEVRLELTQEIAFGQATEEHRLVDLDIPFHQCADGALMCRRAARSDQRGTDAHRRRALLLQTMQRLEQRLERPVGEWLRRLVALVRLEGIKPVVLVHALGLIGEQHRVAIKGDAHLMRVSVGGAGRVRVDLRRRHSRLERRSDIGQMR